MNKTKQIYENRNTKETNERIENMITKMRKKNKTKNVSENKSSTNCPGGFFNQVSKC